MRCLIAFIKQIVTVLDYNWPSHVRSHCKIQTHPWSHYITITAPLSLCVASTILLNIAKELHCLLEEFYIVINKLLLLCVNELPCPDLTYKTKQNWQFYLWISRIYCRYPATPLSCLKFIVNHGILGHIDL